MPPRGASLCFSSPAILERPKSNRPPPHPKHRRTAPRPPPAPHPAARRCTARRGSCLVAAAASRSRSRPRTAPLLRPHCIPVPCPRPVVSPRPCCFPFLCVCGRPRRKPVDSSSRPPLARAHAAGARRAPALPLAVRPPRCPLQALLAPGTPHPLRCMRYSLNRPRPCARPRGGCRLGMRHGPRPPHATAAPGGSPGAGAPAPPRARACTPSVIAASLGAGLEWAPGGRMDGEGGAWRAGCAGGASRGAPPGAPCHRASKRQPARGAGSGGNRNSPARPRHAPPHTGATPA
jgi:hypothetical protein